MRNDLTPHRDVKGVDCVDEERLDKDLYYRFNFVSHYVEFTRNDVSLIQDHLEFLSGVTKVVVERCLRKLLSYHSTRVLLLGTIHDGVVELNTDPDELTMESPSIITRAEIFRGLFYEYLSSNFDEQYFNTVLAKKLSFKWGNRLIDVMLAFNDTSYMKVQILYTELTLQSDLPLETRIKLATSLNKAMGIFMELSNAVLLYGVELPEECADDVSSHGTPSENGYLY
jgi:hypothetical protein